MLHKADVDGWRISSGDDSDEVVVDVVVTVMVIVWGDCGGDPLQSLLDIVIIAQAPEHIGMPPEHFSGLPL